METKPIQFLYNINRMEAVNLIATIHIDDYDTRFLEIVPIDDKTPLVIQGATVTARFVTRKNSLLSDNVACTVTGKNTIIIPIDAAAVHSVACDVKIEVNIVNGTDVLTLPFPLWVRVRGSILGNAHVSPDSEGTIPELLQEVEEELKRVQGFITDDDVYEIMDGAFQGNSTVSPQFLIDSTVDQQYNPFGHLMVYYVDSNDVRHNLYDFYTTFVNMLKYRVVNSPDVATQIGVLYKTEISVDHDSQTVYVWCYENVSQFTQFAYLMNGHIAWRTKDKQTAWQPESDWGAWREIGGTDDYTQLTNKPTINGITVEGAKVANTGPVGSAGLDLLYCGKSLTSESQTSLRLQRGMHEIYHSENDMVVGDGVILNLLTGSGTFPYDSNTYMDGFTGFQFKFPPVCHKNSPPKPLYRVLEIEESAVGFSDWHEINLEQPVIVSAAVNQNGTITFTLSDGSAITTTGTSVIGPQGPAGANGQDGADGVSPTATVTQTATGATITVTDANGTTTANIANGQDYNLTAQDKSDIAALVLAQLPTTQGVQYGN